MEDFSDMAVDLLKSFALGALGAAPAADSSQVLGDNPACTQAYCEVLAYLVDTYCSSCGGGGGEVLDAWAEALQGVAGSGSLAVHTAAHTALRSSALSLLPLMKPALSIVFRDRYQLINVCRQLPSYGYAPVRLVSAFMRALLTDLSPTASLLTVLDSALTDSGAGQANIFGGATGGHADVTEKSRISAQPLPLQQYISDWLHSYLGHFLTSAASSSVPLAEMCAVVKDTICLTQHHIMSLERHQVRRCGCG
jgi:hypothetical protein